MNPAADSSHELRRTCFIDMPFGKKKDLASATEIDFDQIYETAIEPAVHDAGLIAVRGDRERTGGIIHLPMFGRLLLSDVVVADLTLGNPNVFYELGIRHTARPFTTVPIFATIHPLPFDVNLVRAIPYSLDHGNLTPEAAAALRAALRQRLESALREAASADSPLYQLIPHLTQLPLPHQVTEIFQQEVRHTEQFRERLAAARAQSTRQEKRDALFAIETSLGDLKQARLEILADLLLSYRDVSAWDDMVRLAAALPDELQRNLMVRQQWALALNRRNQPGDRDRARRMLTDIVAKQGPDPETLGILGRIYKDQYREAKSSGSALAAGALDLAIETYVQGFESDPRDYYPGVNAITLLFLRGDPASLEQMARLEPSVSFAVARRGGASSTDYWDLATVLEISVLRADWSMAARTLPKVLLQAGAAWNLQTTLDNLLMIREAYAARAASTAELDSLLDALRARISELS